MSRLPSQRRWSVLALSLLTAWNGRVKMDGIEGFGLVWSAVWMADADDEDDQSLWLSNVTGLCRKMQKAASGTEALYDDFEDEDEYWSFDKGAELDVTSVRSEKTLKGGFGGELLDEDGDDGAEVQGKVSASWCESEEESYLYRY